MLTLNLKVFDAEGIEIPALCVNGAVPQQVQSLFSFLTDGMSFVVEVVKTDNTKN